MRRFFRVCVERHRIPQTKLHVAVYEVYAEPAIVVVLVDIEYHVFIRQIIILIKRNIEVRELIARFIPFRRHFKRLRTIRALYRALIRPSVHCVFINVRIDQVFNIRRHIGCCVRNVGERNAIYFFIPTCEDILTFVSKPCSRRIFRYYYRRACFIFRTRNFAAVVIYKAYREIRQFFKMQVVDMEFQISACVRFRAVNGYVQLVDIRNILTACQCRRIQVYSQPALAQSFTLMRCLVRICVDSQRSPQTHLHVIIDEIEGKPAIVIALIQIEYDVLA